MKKRILSLMLILALCLSCVSFALAEEDSSYTIVSPQTSENGITYCDNLLISVKVAENTSMRFTLYSYPSYSDVSSLDMVPASTFLIKSQSGAPEYFKGEGDVSFYTRQVDNVSAGMYSLKIEKLDAEGTAVSTYSKYFIVKPNSQMDSETIYDSETSTGKIMFFQNVFRSLFGTTVVDISE